MHKSFIYISGHVGLETTNIPPRYEDENFFVVKWHYINATIPSSKISGIKLSSVLFFFRVFRYLGMKCMSKCVFRAILPFRLDLSRFEVRQPFFF